MEIEKRLAMLQNTYAASVAETVNTYDKLKVLETIIQKRKERQAQTAPYLNQQLGIESIEDVFYKLSEIYGCANWVVEKTEDGYIATATSCKLCALSRKMGGANPCYGWCLDPMIAMLSAKSKIDAKSITVKSTLMTDDSCKVFINTRTEP
jgi:predicted ArsR family transcriptional regulator